VGLVVEDMAEDLDQRQAPVLALGAAIAKGARQLRFFIAADDADQPLVLGHPGGAQLAEIAVELLVEADEAGVAARQAREPEPVAHQDVVEGAVDGAEEAGARRLALGIAELGAGLVDPPIGPGIVLGQSTEIGAMHRPSPWLVMSCPIMAEIAG